MTVRLSNHPPDYAYPHALAYPRTPAHARASAHHHPDRPPASCMHLNDMSRGSGFHGSGKIEFTGVDCHDVYNIAAPFQLEGGQRIIAGRVELRETELSAIHFFAESDGVWQKLEDAPVFHGLQDPCVTLIGDEWVLGGVRFPVETVSRTEGWRMEFYRGRTLEDLKWFLTGPDDMKDIRLAPLDDDRVAVLTRPQGDKGGLGQIGFFIVSGLDEITVEAIADAPLFHGQCLEEEWVGANEAHLLENGMLGVLGHIACFDEAGDRHYFPMVFAIDLSTGEATQPEVIACRSDFPDGPSKRPDLMDVIFSGGLERHSDGTASLYAGISDTEAGWIRMQDPFRRFL